MPTNRNHEQSVIDGFFDHFTRVAQRHGKRVTRASMDGRDRDLGGDYIFTDNTRFVLAEFKYTEAELPTEGVKPKRRTLCQWLDLNEQKRTQSMSCHYIGWSSGRTDINVRFNQYYPEVCNLDIFGDEALLRTAFPQTDTRISADTLVNDFVNEQVGAIYFEFKAYTNWLIELINAELIEPIEILISDPCSSRMKMLHFGSLDGLKHWLDQTSSL